MKKLTLPFLVAEEGLLVCGFSANVMCANFW